MPKPSCHAAQVVGQAQNLRKLVRDQQALENPAGFWLPLWGGSTTLKHTHAATCVAACAGTFLFQRRNTSPHTWGHKLMSGMLVQW